MKNTATHLLSGLGIIFILSAAGSAGAQESEVDNTRFPYELTGYVGYQSGGDFEVEGAGQEGDVESEVAYALAMNFRYGTEEQYQVFYSHQPAHVDSSSEFPGGVELDIDYAHFGGTLRLDPGSRLEPYLLGSIGATFMSADFVGAQDESMFSVGVGAGLRVPVSKQFNILLEARAFFTFMPTDGTLFCGSGQTGAGCSLRSTGSVFSQYALMAGASFAF